MDNSRITKNHEENKTPITDHENTLFMPLVIGKVDNYTMTYVLIPREW
jgi:hypothetical protein